MFKKRLISALLLTGWLATSSLQAFALTTISSDTTWTPGSIPTAGVSWDGTQFLLNDSLTINNNITLTLQNGINGGSFLLTLPNGGALIINSGGILNLNGVSGNGNGGNFTVNLGGATGTITINGSVRANGIGTGSGGIVNLNATGYTLGAAGLIQAMGGAGGGYGGNVTLTRIGTGTWSLPAVFTVNTSGLTSATQNMITIQADDISIDSTLTADGIMGANGGTIRLISDNGRVKIADGARIYARGNGAGTGGTLELRANLAANTLDIDDCRNNSCTHAQDSEDILVHTSSVINVSGNGNTGIIKIGRAGAGDINMNLGKIATNNFTGAGRVEWGNDGGNTANVTMSSYSVTGDFNGQDPIMALYGTGTITATNSNNFGRVEAHATGASNINITDTTGGMTVTALNAGTGTATLRANNTGAITLQNATSAGTVYLQTNGAITATTNNNLSGTINITGYNGSGNQAGAVSLTNANVTSIADLEANSATITSTGAASDITITNANITNGTTLTSGRDINAGAASNNFGTTNAATGRNIAIHDNTNTLTVNGVTATGTLALTSASGQNIAMSNVDATGAATITAGGGGGDITGNTGLVFRNTANLNSQSNNGGNITVTADFQGNTTLTGDTVAVTDSAGDFTVTGISTGVNGTSTLTANAANSNLTISGINLDSSAVGAAGRLDMSADKNITIDGTGWNTTGDTLNAWSRNAAGGNVSISDVTGIATLIGTAASANPNSAAAGLRVATNGGTWTLNNNSVTGATNIAARNTVTGTGNIFTGSTAFDTNLGTAYDISLASSDFQNATNTFDGADITANDINGFTVSSATATGDATFSANGAANDLTVSNATVTAGTTNLTSGRHIIATNTNNFNNVTISTTGGNAQVTDTTGGMTVTSLTGGGGTHTLIANASGALGLQNATGVGTLNLQTNGSITATTGINYSGSFNISGATGAGSQSGAASLTNATVTNVTRLEAASATVTSSGATSDITVTNANVTGATTLNSGRDVIANSATNNFGTTNAATARNVTMRDNAGTFTVNGITTTGTLDLASAAGSNIAMSNVDATGTTNVTAGGTNSTITGNTGLVFRGAANFNSSDNTGGNITLTGDFQGNTTFTGDVVSATDSAGDFAVTGLSTGSGGTSSLTANGANSNLSLSGINLNSTAVGAAGRVDMSADKNVTINGTGWTATGDVINAWSRNAAGGNMSVSNASVAAIDSTATSVNPNSAVAGIHLATNGGTYTLTNNTVSGATNIQARNTITGTGNTFTGATSFDANLGTAYNISLTGSDFQNATNSFDGANITANDTNGLTVSSATATGNATFTAVGAANDLTVSNATVTAGTTTLTSGRHITATNTNNFNNVAITATGGNANVTDTTGGMTVTSLSGGTGTHTLIANASGALGLQSATGSGTLNLQTGGTITATTSNFYTGAFNITGATGAGSQAGTVNLTNGVATNVTRLESSSNANITSTGATSDITISNATVTGGTTTISSGRHITATNTNNFSNVSITAMNGNAQVTDSGGGMTVTSLTGNTGTHTLIANASGALGLQNATGTGTVNLQTDGNITATTGNNYTGAINITGQAGAGAKAGAVSLTNANNTNINRVEADSASLTATGATRNLTITNASITNGATLTAGQDITANAVTNNFGTSVGGSGRNVTVRDNTGTLTVNGMTATGTFTATSPASGNIVVSNTDVTGATTITAGGTGSTITGTGNTFRSTANLNSSDTAAGNINISGDFQGNTTISGAQVDVTDTAGNLTVVSYNQGAANSTLNNSIGNVTATITDLNTAGAGKLTITANNDINITGTGWTDTNDTLVANSAAGGAFNLTNGTVSKITGRNVAQTGPTSGIWVGTNNGSYNFNGVTSNGNLDVTGANNIVLGSYANSMTISGTTTFGASGDVTGAGTYTGAVGGTASRVGMEALTGNFTSSGITASGGTGWYGASDETLIVATRAGDILGSGFTTSGAGNMRLMAGSSGYINASNDINVTNVSASQNAQFYATGANAGTSINIGGNSSVAGHITAANVTAANQFAATTGGINISLNSGNLTTALLWSDAGTVNLTANNGSILQDTSYYTGSAGVAAGKTIWAKGPVNLSALGGANSYVNTGVMALGTGSNLTVQAQGDSNGAAEGGTSVDLRGRADGNVLVTNQINGNTTGDVNLGTSLGDPNNLDDSPNTVFDVVGTTTVKSNGDVRLYGSFAGAVSVIGRTATISADKLGVNIGSIATSATSGTGVNVTAYRGSVTGSNVSTAGTSHIFLQAGSDLIRDKMSNINLTNVTAGGNLDVVVSGSTTGGSGGQSIVITGSKGGTSSATKPGGGAPVGSVSMP